MTKLFRIFALLGVVAGCGAPDTTASESKLEPVAGEADALYGNVSYASDCSPGQRAFLDQVMTLGRVASASTAFAECLDSRVRSRYRQCNGDPFYGDDIDTQIASVFEATHTFNDVTMNCTGGLGAASAYNGPYYRSDTESLRWGQWFTDAYNAMNLPLCNGSNGPNCYRPQYPQPYAFAAEAIWHEVMHNHGYNHGDEPNSTAKAQCGYSSDPYWNFQYNTMPYIVGSCISEVIVRARNVCGWPLDTNCGPGALAMVHTFVQGGPSPNCVCVHDPRGSGMGVLGMPESAGGALIPIANVSDTAWMGSWNLWIDNQVLTLADVDGDQSKDLVLRSPWGFGTVSGAAGNMHSLAMQPWDTPIDSGAGVGGVWPLSASNTIGPAGDFDDDGREDVIVRSSAGFAIVSVDGGYRFLTREVVQNGQWLGDWHYGAGDVFVGAGDFDGNGRDDILVRSPWGLGVISRTGPGSWTHLAIQPFNGWLGGWYLHDSNALSATGDLNGGGTDIMLRSPWGLGILSVSGSTFNLANIYPNGSALGTWTLPASGDWILNDTANFKGAADFNGDGHDDLVVQSSVGIAIMTRNAEGALRTIATFAYPVPDTWNLLHVDVLSGTGDFNGDGHPDFVLRIPGAMGVLTLGVGIQSIWLEPYGRLLGDWWLKANDVPLAIGDIDGDGRADLLMRR
jgi:hypothetical protein